MNGYRDISVEQYRTQLIDRIIDVREPHEFRGELGHLPGAELVPLATLPAAARRWNPDQSLLIVCRSGARSATAAQLLVSLGFKEVYNLLGGMIAVDRVGAPVMREV